MSVDVSLLPAPADGAGPGGALRDFAEQTAVSADAAEVCGALCDRAQSLLADGGRRSVQCWQAHPVPRPDSAVEPSG